MKRIQSIDMIRGLCLFTMVLYHSVDWWIIVPDRWIIAVLVPILGPLFFTGFLFVSGFSAATVYRKGVNKAATSSNVTIAQIKSVYIMRALLLLVAALLYNTVIAIVINDLTWIWAWNVLQTIAISLLLALPLLRTPMYFRIGLGIGLLILNDVLSPFLLSYRGQLNIYGVLFHILYNPIEQFTIIAYFAMFIFGTVVGDFIFDFNIIIDKEERTKKLNGVVLRTLLIVGILSTIFGITYRFYDFLDRRSISSLIYSIGTILILFAVLLYLEEFEKIKPKKSYRFFFYYSYYSFSIYIAHDILYPLFYRQLNVIIVWFVCIGILTLFTLLLRFLYNRVRSKASLKAQIGFLSLIILNKIDQKRKNLEI
ncbi:MAG: heparan-alpha-glucosaminide N-acetyltransferase domain-containing protein [Candidatus Hermodarchaeota archaeon]